MNEIPILCTNCSQPIAKNPLSSSDMPTDWIHSKTRSPYCYNSTVATPPEE